jgi:hypothetical protein
LFFRSRRQPWSPELNVLAFGGAPIFWGNFKARARHTMTLVTYKVKDQIPKKRYSEY